MEKIEGLQEDVVRLISLNFGEKSGNLFNNFYDHETPEVMLASARELLAELLGPARTEIELEVIYKKYNIQK